MNENPLQPSFDKFDPDLSVALEPMPDTKGVECKWEEHQLRLGKGDRPLFCLRCGMVWGVVK